MSVLWNLFTTFFKIGLFTFGGGYAMIPLLSAELAKKKRWTTDEELMDYYSIGQCTPGIIAVNVSTFIGYKLKGVSGAVAATAGMVAPSVVIIIAIANAVSFYMKNEYVAHAFAGIRIVVIALIFDVVLVSGHHFLPVAAGAGMAVGFAGNGGAGGGGNRSFDQELGR